MSIFAPCFQEIRYTNLVGVDLFECIVGFQPEELAEFVQGPKSPFAGLLHTKNGDCFQASGSIIGPKGTWISSACQS